MLTTKKVITFTGESIVEGTQVAFMSATLTDDDTSTANISKTIINQDLYNANRVAVRKDFTDFDDKVFKEEDRLYTEKIENQEQLPKLVSKKNKIL